MTYDNLQIDILEIYPKRQGRTLFEFNCVRIAFKKQGLFFLLFHWFITENKILCYEMKP